MTAQKASIAITIGDKLRNGATCLQVAAPTAGTVRWTVLALSNDEYVTWSIYHHADGSSSGTCHGHYFGQDLGAALADFRKRAGAGATTRTTASRTGMAQCRCRV